MNCAVCRRGQGSSNITQGSHGRQKRCGGDGAVLAALPQPCCTGVNSRLPHRHGLAVIVLTEAPFLFEASVCGLMATASGSAAGAAQQVGRLRREAGGGGKREAGGGGRGSCGRCAAAIDRQGTSTHRGWSGARNCRGAVQETRGASQRKCRQGAASRRPVCAPTC